ncbi:MAG: hypothetical protein JXR46_16145 [Calditrichaceae bacterium]|nr:hypothetical protein [Calditrichaceae bacterium]MBN2710576.1 hypothetical protein [Calditrichaceae bacterium]RQV94118.1 MAG: hypothetical protein EH224_11020 [Calditrichota bacterium]
MKKAMKRHYNILLVFSVLALAGIIYILYQINTDIVTAINIFHPELSETDYLMIFSHLFILLVNLYALIYLLIHFRQSSALKPFTIVLIIAGIISLFSIGVEKIMIDEIAREYRHGYGLNIGELSILNLAYMINIIFIVTLFVFLLKTRIIVSGDTVKNVVIDEEYFILANFLGFFSGIAGLLFTLHMVQFVDVKLLIEKFWVLIPFYIMFLTPYGLAIFYWLFLKHKQKIVDWYDEKQIQDLLKSSAVTLLLSIPGLSILLLFQIPHVLFLIVYYVFLILLLFSGSALYFSKIKDI